ncbi:cytochrome c1 [Linnemannia zychae]|nr:cytochrome c1 [Linnemannia zychae]
MYKSALLLSVLCLSKVVFGYSIDLQNNDGSLKTGFSLNNDQRGCACLSKTQTAQIMGQDGGDVKLFSTSDCTGNYANGSGKTTYNAQWVNSVSFGAICAVCHSLDRIAWSNLIGVSHTEAEVAAMAEELEYTDEPNDAGDLFQCPGKPSDYMTRPYTNEEQARAGNAGTYPSNLSLMIKAHYDGADPPAGVEIREGLDFNLYSQEELMYENGIPATTSQMAKDVIIFLSCADELEMDERKKMGMKELTILAILTGLSVYLKRHKWAALKNRKVFYNPPTP